MATFLHGQGNDDGHARGMAMRLRTGTPRGAREITGKWWNMRLNWLWAALVLCLAATPALAETVHLKSGEAIKGRIVRTDEQSISIESDEGFGVVNIPREDIQLIEFANEDRDLSRTIGIGYHHRTSSNTTVGQPIEYGVDALSLKFWLNRDDSIDMLLGFYDTSVDGNTALSVFSFDVRYGSVFARRGNLDLYWGASVGYLNVEDNTSGQSFEGTGYTYQAFLGTEVFFVTLPNLGISAEVGVGLQTIGDRRTTNIATTTFPSLSMRYYY